LREGAEGGGAHGKGGEKGWLENPLPGKAVYDLACNNRHPPKIALRAV